MSRGQIAGLLSVVVLVVTLLAAIGPAAQAVWSCIEFLWPIGVVGWLVALCTLLGLLLWRKSRPSADAPPARRMRWDEPAQLAGVPALADSASSREKREAAYDAMLSTSEAYINAHRGVDALSDPDVYPPDLEEAEAARHLANVGFVAARQRVEQHGVKPVLDATLAIEEAVNKGDYDKAAEVRRDQLVSAVRKDMNRPTSTF
jgi:hypothetical protein